MIVQPAFSFFFAVGRSEESCLQMIATEEVGRMGSFERKERWKEGAVVLEARDADLKQL